MVKGLAGQVFTDVELAGGTVLEYYDANDVLIHTQAVPEFSVAGVPDTLKGLSFAGVSFADAVIGRVHIKNGGYDLNLTQFDVDDAVAMDDLTLVKRCLSPEPKTLLVGLRCNHAR